MMPVITSMSTRDAVPGGGTTIVVKGSGFGGTTRVYVRDQNLREYNAKSYTVDSDSQITLVTPAVESNGTYHVYIIAGGQKSTTPGVYALLPDGDGGGTPSTVAGDNNRLRISHSSGPSGLSSSSSGWSPSMLESPMSSGDILSSMTSDSGPGVTTWEEAQRKYSSSPYSPAPDQDSR